MRDYNKMNEYYDKGRDLRMRNQQDGQALQHVGQSLKMGTTTGWTMDEPHSRKTYIYIIWVRTRTTELKTTMLRGEVQRIEAMCRPWQFSSVEYTSDTFYA
jgi:hypothetical protein